jgi:2,4-dienoyl-CoA reductase-like NADH-dependent reductase (Old Yellow Enzyme family)/thioredoxin reductase
MSFPRLFTPGQIGSMEVRNRIIGSPMERNYCTAEGRVTQRYVDYLEARSRGGVGLLYTEATYVDPRGKGREFQMGLHDDDLIPDFKRLVTAVKRHGARIGPELNYGGRVVDPVVSGLQSRAPSVVPYVGAGGASPVAFNRSEIREIVERFAAAAGRAIEAGCDFVGIHGAHGYLLSQFVSPFCNHRDDEYGGDLQGRIRFPLEVIAAIRRTIGPNVPMLYRISGDEHQTNGTTLEDVCAIAPQLQAAGVNLIDVSAGMYETNWWITQPMEMPQGILAPLARAVRANVQVPVSVSGRITDPSVAEHVLESGDADFVTLGRAMHADPEFPNKARDGRLDEICTCIACNQGCSDMHARGLPIVCVVNTATGREREYAIRPAAQGKRIVVVGAGPAGLESARVLALRGHRVTLFERYSEPGGQLLLNRFVPGREEMAGHIPWLASAAAKAGVRLEFSVEADLQVVMAEKPDIVIVATGAVPGLPQIPGVMNSPIVNAYDVLRHPKGGIGRALVIGGGIRGVGVARALAEKGVEIVLVEAGSELVTDIASRSRRFQIQGLADHSNITVHRGVTVEELKEHSAVLCNGKEQWELGEIDLVIPTRLLVPVNDVANALYERANGASIYLVGDCVHPRNALDAMHDAAALGHRL